MNPYFLPLCYICTKHFDFHFKSYSSLFHKFIINYHIQLTEYFTELSIQIKCFYTDFVTTHLIILIRLNLLFLQVLKAVPKYNQDIPSLKPLKNTPLILHVEAWHTSCAIVYKFLFLHFFFIQCSILLLLCQLRLYHQLQYRIYTFFSQFRINTTSHHQFIYRPCYKINFSPWVINCHYFF